MNGCIVNVDLDQDLPRAVKQFNGAFASEPHGRELDYVQHPVEANNFAIDVLKRSFRSS